MRLRAEHLSAIVDAARDAIVSIDQEARITMFNPAAERMFGYREDEVLGQPVALLMPPPHSDEHLEYLRRYQEGGSPKAIGRIRQVDARRKDGQVFPIELAVSETRVDADVVYSAIIRDVTAARGAAEALRQETELAASVIEAAPMIVLILDSRGCIRSFNPYMERLSGYRLAEVAGRDWFTSFLPKTHQAGIRRLFERVIGGTPTGGNVNPIVAKDGTEIEIEWNEALLHDQFGNIGGVLAIGQDVTARKRSGQQQRLAEIGAVAARIVHDVRNPLAGLSMLTQSLLRQVDRDPGTGRESLRSSAELILETVARLDRLIGEFRDFARDLKLELTEIDLPAFLERLVAFWSVEATARGIRLVLEDVPVQMVVGDEDKLRRVFDNLVKNAIEALDGHGSIVVATSIPESGKVRISVADDGPGIVADTDVFGLFTTTKSAGTGLGLPIVRQILEAHGGGIVLATGSSHGATFHVDLPTEGASLS